MQPLAISRHKLKIQTIDATLRHFPPTSRHFFQTKNKIKSGIISHQKKLRISDTPKLSTRFQSTTTTLFFFSLTLSFFQTFQLPFLSFAQKPLPIWKQQRKKFPPLNTRSQKSRKKSYHLVPRDPKSSPQPFSSAHHSLSLSLHNKTQTKTAKREKESAICEKPIKEKTYLRPPEALRKTAKLRNDGPQHLTTKRDFVSQASAKP